MNVTRNSANCLMPVGHSFSLEGYMMIGGCRSCWWDDIERQKLIWSSVHKRLRWYLGKLQQLCIFRFLIHSHEMCWCFGHRTKDAPSWNSSQGIKDEGQLCLFIYVISERSGDTIRDHLVVMFLHSISFVFHVFRMPNIYQMSTQIDSVTRTSLQRKTLIKTVFGFRSHHKSEYSERIDVSHK